MAEQIVDYYFARQPVECFAASEVVLATQYSEPLMAVEAGGFREVEVDPVLERLPRPVVSTSSAVCRIETCPVILADSVCQPAAEPLQPPPLGLELALGLAPESGAVRRYLSCPAARSGSVAGVPAVSAGT